MTAALRLVVLALVVAGCELLPLASPIPAIPAGPEAAEIAAHQRAWQQLGVRSYTWQVTFGCECGLSGPTSINVVDGAATTASNPAGPINMDDASAFPFTVDALFAEALRTIANGGAVKVTWDPATGLPKTMFLDRDLRAIDDELSVSVDSFQPAG